MHLDVPTISFVSATITATVCLATLFYSLSRRENHTFIWVAVASGGFSLGLYMTGLRGIISDFLSIVVTNELATFTFVAFYEGYRRLLGVRPKGRFVGPTLLLAQFLFFVWFTHFQPDFEIRVIGANTAFLIMSTCVMQLLWSSSSKSRRLFHLFAAVPFALLALFSVARLINVFFGPGLAAKALNTPEYALTMLFYGTMATWMSLSIFFIVTDRLQGQIREMALTDPLTGILNRRALLGVAKREISRANRSHSPLSFIISDLDHFKKINDDHGHQTGDEMLKHIAMVFQTGLRAEDVLARYGGEEFLIILPGVDSDGAMTVAERLRMSCKNNALVHEGRSLLLTASFGVTAFEENVDTYESLVQRADEALYQAKAAGRDVVVLSGVADSIEAPVKP